MVSSAPLTSKCRGYAREVAGNRQHFIPRFLLKGFAIPGTNAAPRVWVYRREGPPFESSIDNVAVEKHFYGKAEESTLDAHITQLETDFAQVVAAVRELPSATHVAEPAVPRLAAHLFARTRQIRLSFESAFQPVLDVVQEWLTTPGVMREYLLSRPEVRSRVETELRQRGLPVELTDLALQQILPAIRPQVHQMIRENLPAMLDALNEGRASITPSIREGHNRSLAENPDAEGLARRFSEWNWWLLRSGEPLILGDSVCVFQYDDSDAAFRAFPDFSKSMVRIWLPIATHRVLVASPARKSPKLDQAKLNKACARCSIDHFVGSRQLPENSALPNRIGEWAGILTAAEQSQIAGDLLRSLKA